MKKLMLLALMSSNLMAAERVLLADSKIADVNLNRATVRCSGIGYGFSELKISIKDLDGWTIFDHSNTNLGDIGGPCMTAGRCQRFERGNDRGYSIDDILNGGTRVEQIKIARQIVEVKTLEKDENADDYCSRHIEERLQANVNRGDGKGVVAFNHLRSGLEEKLPVSSCKLQGEM